MSVRCKFQVVGVTDRGQGVSDVHLQPVYSGSPENETFFQATPAGSIAFSNVNAEAAKEFQPGKQFYVDFTAAE